MIGCGGAARNKQFGQRHPHGEAKTLAVEMIAPQRIKLLQPGKQRLLDRLGVGTRQWLVEMVMGVDEAGQDDVPPRIEDFVIGQRRSAPADEFDDLSGLDHEAAGCAFGQHCDGIAYPDTHASTFTIHISLLTDCLAAGECQAASGAPFSEIALAAPSRLVNEMSALPESSAPSGMT